MKFPVLLFLVPAIFSVVSGENCIELQICEQLSWLNETKNNSAFDNIRNKFACSEPVENMVNCPVVTTDIEALNISLEEILVTGSDMR